MLTPVEATTAGGATRRAVTRSRVARLKVDRHQPQPVGHAVAELGQALPLPGLGPGLVDLEHPQPRGEAGPALGEGVQARAQDDVLPDAAVGLLGHEVLDEPRPGHDPGPEPAGALGVHVPALAPVRVRVGQLQADLVGQHVRRRVDLDVHGPPQRDPHGGVVRPGSRLVSHQELLSQ
jgi:hypothetical protein